MEDKSARSRPYFRESTAAQRRLLFEIWERTGHAGKASSEAHLSRGTFYYWKERFEQSGYAGVETTASHAPHHPAQTAPEVVAQIVALKEAHREWGKHRIADELMKSNDWKPLVSASTVYNILVAKGLIQAKARQKKNANGSKCGTQKGQGKP